MTGLGTMFSNSAMANLVCYIQRDRARPTQKRNAQDQAIQTCRLNKHSTIMTPLVETFCHGCQIVHWQVFGYPSLPRVRRTLVKTYPAADEWGRDAPGHSLRRAVAISMCHDSVMQLSLATAVRAAWRSFREVGMHPMRMGWTLMDSGWTNITPSRRSNFSTGPLPKSEMKAQPPKHEHLMRTLSFGQI